MDCGRKRGAAPGSAGVAPSGAEVRSAWSSQAEMMNWRTLGRPSHRLNFISPSRRRGKSSSPRRNAESPNFRTPQTTALHCQDPIIRPIRKPALQSIILLTLELEARYIISKKMLDLKLKYDTWANRPKISACRKRSYLVRAGSVVRLGKVIITICKIFYEQLSELC